MRERMRWLGETIQDLRFAGRLLRTHRASTVVAVATLALGVGANTAMFSVVQSVLLQRLPYGHPERILWITERDPRATSDLPMIASDDLAEWRTRARSFEALSVLFTGDATAVTRDDAFEWRVACVSDTLTRVFGVAPASGRDFLAEDFVEAPQPPGVRRSAANRRDAGVAIISDRVFRRQFDGDPAAIGQRFTIGNVSYVVVGVLPPAFRLPMAPSLQFGIGPRTDVDAVLNTTPGPGYLGPGGAVGRLATNVSSTAALAELTTIRDALNQAKPDRPSARFVLRASSLHEHVVAGSRRALLLLWGAVGFVLLVAAVNIVNLLLARSVARRREMAVRIALGAGRWRLVRQMLAEGAVLAGAGSAAGLALAYVLVHTLARSGAIDVPRLQDATLSGPVIAFSAFLCGIGAIVFGAVPAFSANVRLHVPLKEGGASGLTSRQTRQWHAALVIGEIGLALIPLTGAGLMLRSLQHVRAEAAVLDPERVLTAQIQPRNPQALATPADALRAHDELLAQIASLPGVRAAALWRVTFGLPARIVGLDSPEPQNVAMWFSVSPGFHEAAGGRLLAGRWFTDRDRTATPAAVVVSERFARKFAGAFTTPADIIGHMTLGPSLSGASGETVPMTIIGVVSDFRSGRFGILQPDDTNALPQVFFPDAGRPVPGGELLVRTNSDPLTLVAPIQRLVASQQNLRFTGVRTLDDQLASAVAPRMFNTVLFVVFGVMALALAMVGVAGVLWHAVTERAREFAVRVALGAERTHIVHLVLSYAGGLVAAGLAIGLTGSIVLSRLVGSLLYGVAPTDAWAYVTVSLFLIVVSLLAAYLPARRAIRVDPMVVLRQE